jgi:hypothetical protein
MHLPINVKSPNNISKWQMEFNSAFKELKQVARNPEADSYTAMKRMARNNSRWKAAIQSKD